MIKYKSIRDKVWLQQNMTRCTEEELGSYPAVAAWYLINPPFPIITVCCYEDGQWHVFYNDEDPCDVFEEVFTGCVSYEHYVGEGETVRECVMNMVNGILKDARDKYEELVKAYDAKWPKGENKGE